jgi:hypothetical protein
VGTPRAGFTLGVVDAFFVRAVNKAVGDDHGLGDVLFAKDENLVADGGVSTHVDTNRRART